MAEPARAVSLLFRPGETPAVVDEFADVLADHLVGHRLEVGQRVALPGWPCVTVEDVDPPGGSVGRGTEVEITVPPAHGEGPLHLAILVDASLTMGEGTRPRPYDRAASLVDAFLMNGRSFLASVGIVVQGGETRNVEELAAPETLSGALIHRTEPRGTFALERGLRRALALLEDAEEGPRAILLVTDGDLGGIDPVACAGRLARSGVRLFALAEELPPALDEACGHTGGLAGEDAEAVFTALAETCGARAQWRPPEPPERVGRDPEFETVIETVEEEA